MLYINKLRPGDIIIPGYLDRFEDTNGDIQLTRESDAYTLIVNDPNFHIEDYPNIKSFVIIAHAGHIPEYDGFKFIHNKQICCDELNINDIYHEYVNTKHIDSAKININCTNCKNCINCINCRDCKDCIECEDCIHCVECEDCDFCKECEYCLTCYDCFDCSRCEYSCNCVKCSACHRCYDNNNCNDCDDCDDCCNCSYCDECANCKYCSRCKYCEDYYDEQFTNGND